MKNNIQDIMLNQARKEKMEITLYLSNGVPLKGKVISFDNFTIVLEQQDKQYLIYKHAITTLIPSQKISLLNSNNEDNDSSPDKTDKKDENGAEA